jgi:hypothetical protein
MRKIIFVLILLSVSGCVSHYKAPIDEPTALLELNSNVWPVIVQHFEDEQCTAGPNGIRLSYLHPTFGDQPSGTSKTIAANREFLVSFQKVHHNAYTSGWECTVTGIFHPKAGTTYKATYHFEGSNCYLGILRKEVRGERVDYVPETSYRRSGKNCVNSSTD